MKSLATIIPACLAFFLLYVGCSRDEQTPPPAEKHKVTRPIDKSKLGEAKSPLIEEGERPGPGAEEAERPKAPAIEAERSRVPEEKRGEAEKAMEQMAGYYVVKKDETLSRIAALPDVYGNPLKWPILFRHNLQRLRSNQVPDAQLPQGLGLKVISPEEIKGNLEKRSNNVWVVNVISSTVQEKITTTAINLIVEGYEVYITRARVKGKDWFRLRVGFYKSRNEASAAAKKIMAILDITDSWVTKVGKREFKAFAGY
jgi:cell division protein FtsN